jgi:hypothetical protein
MPRFLEQQSDRQVRLDHHKLTSDPPKLCQERVALFGSWRRFWEGLQRQFTLSRWTVFRPQIMNPLDLLSIHSAGVAHYPQMNRHGNAHDSLVT